MKKLLLTVAASLLFVCGTFAKVGDSAYRSGNLYYTDTQAWKIVSPNMINNGSFAGDDITAQLSAFNTTATLDDGTQDRSAMENFFIVQEGEGPSGQNVLEVTATGALNSGGDVYISQPLSSGYYVISYKVLGAADRIMGNPNGDNDNRHRIFLNNDGTVTMNNDADFGNGGVPVSKYLRYGTNWTEIAYVVSFSDDFMYAVINLSKLQVGDQFTDFAIYQVQEAFDGRQIERMRSKIVQFLSDEEGFPNGREDMEGLIEAIDELLSDDTVSPADVENTVSDISEAFNAFMDLNTVDVSDYFKNFDLGPELTSNQSKTRASGWNLSGDTSRWNRKIAAPSIGMNSTHINQEAGATSTVLGEDSYYQTAPLIPGTYLYTVKCKANYLWKGTEWGESANGSYNVNYADTIAGLKFYVNKDTVEMEHVSTSYAKEYSIISEVVDSSITIGFKSPGAAKANGGDFRFDNVEIRLLGGWTKEQVDYAYWGVNVATQRDVLEERVAYADSLCASDMYIYGKDVLTDSINEAKAALATENQYTQDYYQYLLNHVNWIKKAWQAYETLNLEYTTLKNSVNTANDLIADESRPKSKPALQTVIDESNTVLAAVTVPKTETDSLSMVEQNVKLQEAIETFLLDNASLATPYVIEIQDPALSSGTGWTVETNVASNQWGFGSQGYSYSRGNAANDAQYVYQETSIKRPGIYLFSALIAANNNGNRDSEETGVYIFVGNDSLQVHTAPIKEDWNPGTFATFTVRTIVENVDEVNPLRFGLNARWNKVCNMIRFGNAQLEYCGSYEEYVKDSIALVMKPTKDSLQQVINELTALKLEARNPNNVDASALDQPLAQAQNVVNNSEDFSLILAQFDLLEAARRQFVVSGVYPAEGKRYDLSFIIKNPTFSQTDGVVDDWTSRLGEDEVFNVTNGMILNNLTGVADEATEEDVTPTAYYGLSQQLTNIPAGAYRFQMNATYHGNSRNNNFEAANYGDVLWVYAGNDTVVAKPIYYEGLTIEGDNTDYNSQYSTFIVYYKDEENDANSVKLSLYDYRHGATCGNVRVAFPLGFYRSMADMDVASAADVTTVGFFAKHLSSSASNIFVANPALFFYGDDANRPEVDEGIAENIVSVLNAAAVYNLAGQRVSGKLQKGLYIQGGKKFIVK